MFWKIHVIAFLAFTDPSGSPFSESGFKNWKKAMEKNSGIKQHDKSVSHKLCMTKWEYYYYGINSCYM